MSRGRVVKWTVLLLGLPLSVWIVAGSLGLYADSQRMKNRHDTFRDEVERASASSREHDRQAWLSWTCTTSERLRYEILLFDDRTYRVTVRSGGGTDYSGPDRLASGKASAEAWKALRDVLEDPENLNQRAAGARFDPRTTIEFSLPGTKRRSFSFDHADYAAALPEVRRVDERIAELIESSDLRPPRRYARIPPPVRYGREEIANLVRGLEADRPAAFPRIVRQLTAIGEPALPELARVLSESNPRDAVAQKRIEAVLGGLDAFPESHARVLPRVREIAAMNHPNARRGPLVRRAADFVENVVIGDFQREALARRGFAFTPFIVTPPPRVRRNHEVLMSTPRRPGLVGREALARELEALGPDVIPLILESLDGNADSRRSGGLIDALGGIGGPDAILFALHRGVFEAKDSVRSLARLGESAIPALLFLLEHGRKHTGSEIVTVFHRDEIYRATHSRILEMMERQRKAYGKATEEALRLLHREGARNLVDLLMAWGVEDSRSVQSLLDTALDTEQHDSLRGAALGLLRRIGSPAEQVADALQERAGYESGSMRARFIRTAKAVSGEME